MQNIWVALAFFGHLVERVPPVIYNISREFRLAIKLNYYHGV